MRLIIILLGLLIVGCETVQTIKEPSAPPPITESTVIKTAPCDVHVIIEFEDFEEFLVIEIPPEMVCPDKDVGNWI